MTIPITIKKYSQPNCGPCKMVNAYLNHEKKFIEESVITIEEIDVSQLTDDQREALPYKQVPFIEFYRNGALMATSRGMSIPDEFRDCVKIAKEDK